MSDDELLPGSDRDPAGPWSRRVAALVAVVLIAAVVVVLLNRGGSDDVAAGPKSSAPSSAPPSAVLVVPTSEPAGVTGSPTPQCRDTGERLLGCDPADTPPDPLLRAVRTVFADAAVTGQVAVFAPDGTLSSRQLSARDRTGRTLRIDIGAPTGQHSLIAVPSSANPTLLRFDVDVRRHHVTVTVRAADPDRMPSVGVVRRLATDRRLLGV